MTNLIVAVIGVNGFIGSSIASKLLSDGVEVVGFSREKPKSNFLSSQKFKWIPWDFLTSQSDMENYLVGVQVVIHCAGHYQANFEQLNLYNEFSHRLAVAAKRVVVKKYILISSIAVYGQHDYFSQKDNYKLSLYAESRLRAEHDVQNDLSASETKLVILRLPSVVGVSMPSNVIRSFCSMLRLGIFFHPGKKETYFACVGIKRLTYLLSWLARSNKCVDAVVEPVDSISWLDMASTYSRISSRDYFRIEIPSFIPKLLSIMFGKRFARALSALSDTRHYMDSSTFDDCPELPKTIDDIEEVMKKYLSE